MLDPALKIIQRASVATPVHRRPARGTAGAEGFLVMGFLEACWSPAFVEINGLGDGGLLETPLGVFKMFLRVPGSRRLHRLKHLFTPWPCLPGLSPPGDAFVWQLVLQGLPRTHEERSRAAVVPERHPYLASVQGCMGQESPRLQRLQPVP